MATRSVNIKDSYENCLGFVTLETSIWLLILLPITLICVAISVILFNCNILNVIPTELLRQELGEGVHWDEAISNAGNLSLDVEHLEGVITDLANQSLAIAHERTLGLKDLSAWACYWVIAVDDRTGQLRSPINTRCIHRGASTSHLSLDTELEVFTEQHNGIPLLGTSRDRYVPIVIALGVKIGGSVNTLGVPIAQRRIEHGTVSFPRRELQL